MKRIAVNTRMLLPDKMEGIGYFTYETFSRITKLRPDTEFIFLFDRPYDKSFIFSPNITPVEVFPPARHPFLWYLWYEHSLPRLFKKYKPDLFVGTDGYLPTGSKVPALSVIHDINFEHYPKDVPFWNRTFYRHYFPKYARIAKRIATVSEFTANDVVKTYGIDRAKIDIVYNGASENFKPLTQDKIEACRKKYSEGLPYFIFIGSIHQRKNIVNLLKAYEDFRNQSGERIKLLFAGAKRWWTDEMESTLTALTFKDDVIFTGRLTQEELCNVTASALALSYVSTFEGFGIPIIEAMKAGIPVITSDVTSMPEVAGGAALLCNPFDVKSISKQMIAVAKDAPLRQNLISLGLEQSKKFTWDASAKALLASIDKCFCL